MDTLSFTLPKNSGKIDLSNIEFVRSSYIQEPMISLGFNLFMMKNREKLQIVQNLPESQKRVHFIFNDYDAFLVSQPDKSIKEYFQTTISKSIPITNNSYFKVWEIICEFSLLDSKESTVVISIGDGPGSVIQSLITYRNKFHSKISSKDLYCVLGILDEQKIDCFSNSKIYKDENIIREFNDVKLFKKGFLKKTKDLYKDKKYANLIVCDGDMNWYNENYQEQEMIELLFGEIVFALNLLEDGGSLVLKIYDTFTMLTIRLISILNTFFNEIHIYKPLTSSQASSEKFVIGKGFKSNKNNINSLNKLFEDIEKESFIVDINNFEINDNMFKEIIKINQTVSDLQYQKINQMYSFLLKKNFFGVEYHEQVKKQIECNSKWLAKYVKN